MWLGHHRRCPRSPLRTCNVTDSTSAPCRSRRTGSNFHRRLSIASGCATCCRRSARGWSGRGPRDSRTRIRSRGPRVDRIRAFSTSGRQHHSGGGVQKRNVDQNPKDPSEQVKGDVQDRRKGSPFFLQYTLVFRARRCIDDRCPLRAKTANNPESIRPFRSAPTRSESADYTVKATV